MFIHSLSPQSHILNGSSSAFGLDALVFGLSAEAVRAAAFLHRHGRISDLGTLGGATSVAWAIDNAGRIVGHSTTATGEGRAFLYRDGVMTDLNVLVAPSPFGMLEAAHFIADNGDIVASARDACGQARVVLLRRIAPAQR